MFVALYFLTTLICVYFYARASIMFLKNFQAWEYELAGFSRWGWLSVFDNDADFCGQYILRLSMGMSVFMVFLNLASLTMFVGGMHDEGIMSHIFSYQEVMWRVVNLIGCFLMVFLAKHFKKILEPIE